MLKAIAKGTAKALGYRISRDRPPPADPPVSESARQLIRDMWPLTTEHRLLRYGGAGDGAYLVPDDLEGITALFSPGVDQLSVFEDEMASKGMACYLADASVSGPGVDNPAFHFERKFLGLRNDGQIMTLDSWVDRLEPGDHDLMLQMDIEGAEWTVLAGASARLLSRFRIMVIEFHWMSMLFNSFTEQVVIDVIQRLLATHHVVHNHPNNAAWIKEQDGVEVPEVIEVTFLRKDRASTTRHATEFPHTLDIVNMVEREPLTLPPSWHG